MRRTRLAVCAGLLSIIASGVPGVSPAAAGTDLPVGPFRSITLHSGGHVLLRHGPGLRVRLVEGSSDFTSVRVEGDRLLIDRTDTRRPRGYRMQIEVTTPEILDIAVSDGGTVQTLGSFPAQGTLHVAVENGGTIDARSLRADDVAARIQQGGRILAKPQRALVASVAHGGAITYWGSPTVDSAVDDGGVVDRGRPGDADRPLDALSPDASVAPRAPIRRMF